MPYLADARCPMPDARCQSYLIFLRKAISFFVAYLLVLSAVTATGRCFRTGGKLRARELAALAMNSANHIMSDSWTTIFRSGQVYWISDLYYRQCVKPPLGEFWLIYLTSYSGSQESEVWGQILCPCPMPYALCPMPYARESTSCY